MAEENKYNRIIYIEPNDVFDAEAGGSHKGLALTPKYEDFCISFNLIIETFSRFKTDATASGNGSDNQTQKYSIQWGLTREEMVKRRTSVLEGDRGEDTLNTSDGNFAYSNSPYNYLTTYYTDLSYDTYREKTEIEGLGVESVQISYESWYTPTVVIKFVDVRGSALFGREEAIHVDEKLRAENIFGAFFTMPYPLFRLQVKGFLGKPVTYQLTCSNFKGEFNSSTGNFEAVATFIGYSWSLLTDIPFAYLVAAPEATYIGSEYWNRKRNSKEWRLWDDSSEGRPPMKLLQLFQNINDALSNNDFAVANDEQSAEMQSLSNEEELLAQIRDSYVGFCKSLQQLTDNRFFITKDTDEKNEQLILFSKSNTVRLTQEAKNKYEEYYKALKEYKDSGFTNAEAINTDKMVNKWKSCPPQITLLDKFTVNSDDNGDIVSISVKELRELSVETLMTLSFNEIDSKLTETSAKKIYENIVGDIKNNIMERYAYVIDLYDVYMLVTERINAISKRKKDITDEINNNVSMSIVDILSTKRGDRNANDGFKPFIGNIFKIIFCHLETFCHIMFDSADEIYRQKASHERDAEYLGITFDKTDIKQGVSEFVTPWPAIYNNGVTTSECGYTSESQDVYGWVGDLPYHRFIEEKVVYSIQEGVQRIVNTTSNDYVSKNYTYFPILPYDFGSGSNPFSTANISSVSDLAGHLANRLTSIIGVLCGNNINEETVKTIGKMDAYNLYSSVATVSSLSNIIKNVDESILEGIMYCDNRKECEDYATPDTPGSPTPRHHSFETRKIDYSKNGRQPFFIDDSKKAHYIHFYDKNNVNYVPSAMKEFKYYANNGDFGDFKYSIEDNRPVFTPNTKNGNDGHTVSYEWLYTADSTTIKSLDGLYKSYFNYSMFNVITDKGVIDGIRNKCDAVKNGNVKIGEYEVTDDLSAFCKKFIKIGFVYTKHFFDNVCYMLSGNSSLLKIDSDKLLPDSNENARNPKEINYSGWYTTTNMVTFNDKGEPMFNGKNVDSSQLVIQQFKVTYLGEVCNIFGCPFYYLQNVRRKNENDAEYERRRIMSKALLFLHTFKYNYDTPLNVFSKQKNNGVIEEVPKGYLLFLGALLWRKRYAEEHNNADPLIYKDNACRYRSTESSDYTLFECDSKGGLYFTIYTEKVNYKNRCKISKFFDGENIDYNIENQLIALFEIFATTTFKDIANQYELVKIKDKVHSQINNAIEMVKIISQIYSVSSTEGLMEILANDLTNWLGKYSAIAINKSADKYQGLKLLFNENNTEYQKLFIDLYCGSYVISDNCYRRMGKSESGNSRIYVNKSLLKSYLNGFKTASNNIITNETVTIGNDSDVSVSKDTTKNRDLSLSIYYYLKNLWDKWLVIADNDAFNVENYFTNNFVFTDSFYKNTYHNLAINCEKLLDAWKGIAENGSLFHFISQIVTDHGCIFLPVPDYIGFNGKSRKEDIETMENLFRPMPYMSIPSPSNNNKFIVMYTHSPSHITSEDNGYPIDSYDIWSHKIEKDGSVTGEYSEVARQLFGTTNDPNFDSDTDIATREGYNVPSFGISFGRQNNHIFKNLKVNMENPVMTEQAIKAQYQIALKGSSSAKSICFIGQDTFNVYSNYSYSINVEMMGNAQICPLMYFQLTNIPLWRGTYMIYKVMHNMTPGNMTTTVTAMKMNKFAQPFNTSFFSIRPRPDGECEGNYLYDDCDEEPQYSDYDNTKVIKNSRKLPSESLTSKDGKFKIGKAFRIIYEKAYATVDKGIIGNLENNYSGQCTRGPYIILCRAFGIPLKPNPISSREDVLEILMNNHFHLKFYGKIKHTPGGTTPKGIKDNKVIYNDIPLINQGVRLQVGDVAFMTDRKTYFHMCIWSGSSWVSDCWQNSLSVHNQAVLEDLWIWSYNYPIGKAINLTPYNSEWSMYWKYKNKYPMFF